MSAAATAAWQTLCCLPLLVWLAVVLAISWGRRRCAGWWWLSDAQEPSGEIPLPPPREEERGEIVLRMNFDNGKYRWVRR